MVKYAENLKFNTISKKDEDFFSRDNELSFYWAGFLAADGYIRENKKKNSTTYFVSCRLATADRAHLEKFAKDLKYSGNIYDQKIIPVKNNILLKNKTHKEVYYSSSIEISSKKLHSDIQRFGITKNKTYSYTMPEWLINHNLINHFIRGYIDGDGSIYRKNSKNKIRMGVSLLGACVAVEQIFKIIKRDCEIIGGHFRKEPNEYSTLINYFSFDSIFDFGKIMEYLYNNATVYLDRKKIKPSQIEDVKKSYSFDLNMKNKKVDNRKKYNFDPEELKLQYDKHQSVIKLSKIYGCSTYTILFYMKKFNIEYQGKSSNFVNKKMYFDKDILQQQYSELKSFSKVSKLYNCSISAIRTAVKRFEIKDSKIA